MVVWKKVAIGGVVAAAYLAFALQMEPLPTKPSTADSLAGAEVVKPWPLKPDWVTLSCEPGDYLGVRRVFVTTPDGTRYAANGSARSMAPLTTPIETDPNTSALISRGLALCEAHAEPIIVRKG